MPRSIHLDPNIQLPLSDPDTWLNRAEAAAALTAAGYQISAATLASKATRGDGPPYRVFNGIAKSRWGILLKWAEAHSVYRGSPLPIPATVRQHIADAPVKAA
jgi:hypothetical protein